MNYANLMEWRLERSTSFGKPSINNKSSLLKVHDASR